MEADEAVLKALREPFPAETIGLLPKSTRRNVPEDQKHVCAECGANMGPHIHLNYVGHAAVTDRLLTNDILWEWEAYSTDEQGLPAFRESPNGMEIEFWIRLTVAGKTRPGVGVVDKSKSDLAKELISDALKNAAMRFGVALDLWSKDELESLIGNQAIATRRRNPPRSSTSTTGSPRRTEAKPSPAPPSASGEPAPTPAPDHPGMNGRNRNKLVAFLHQSKIDGDAAVVKHVNELLSNRPTPVGALTELSVMEGELLFEMLGIEA